jgi:hypothetical protein
LKVFALKRQYKMKKIILLIFCVLIVKLSYPISPGESNNALLLNVSNTPDITINKSYQQFKYQVINYETSYTSNFDYLKKRRKKNDNLMLYVAGGLAVATATLILANDPENFTSNSTSSVNLGIAVGGTLACGLIVVKHFVDKSR